jgi:hypothetical protein
MTAASIFLDTLAVANRQIDSTAWHAKVANVLLGITPIALLNMLLAAMLSKGALVFRKDAATLRGLAASVADMREGCVARSGTGTDNALSIQALLGLNKRVMEARSIAMRLDVTDSVRVKTALRSFASASSDLYDAITQLRWELMELDATLSPCGEGYSASTPEELDKVFDRILSE